MNIYTSKKINNKISTAIICALLTVVPLFLHNKYFDAIESKAFAYRAISYLCLAAIAVAIILSLIAKNKSAYALRMSLSDWSIFGFGIAAVISGVFSENFNAALLGSSGWYVGCYVILSLCIIYFFLSRNLPPEYEFKTWFYVVCNIIFIIGLIRFFGLDLFSLHSGMEKKQLFQYISTYGNTNWYQFYLCCTVIFTAVNFLSEKRKYQIILQTITLVFGIFNILISICDAIYFVIAVVVIFIAPLLKNGAICLRRVLLITLIFGTEALIVELLPCFEELLSGAAGLSKFIIDWRIGALIISASIIGLILLKIFDKKIGEKFCNFLSVFVCVGAACAVLGYIVFSVLTFSDNYGTRRGLIWRVSLNSFCNFSIKEKIFGVGPDMLKTALKEVSDTFGRLTLSAHSEFFQVLLGEGIFGFVCWLCAWIGLIISYFKYKIFNTKALAYFVALAGILSLYIFNSSMVTTIMLTAIFASIYKSKILNMTKNKDPCPKGKI